MTRVLIVDDDADILELLRLEVEDEAGCRADSTTNPLHALDLARSTLYDAIITDWRMPVMNGREFIDALRHQGCRSYIIIYSAIEPDDGMKRTLEAGADQYILRRGSPDREFGELKTSLRMIPTHHHLSRE